MLTKFERNIKEVRKASGLSRLLLLPEVQSWRALMSAFQRVFGQLETSLLEEGYSAPRFQILFHLYFDGPLAAVELAKRLLVTRGNISTFIKRMQRDSLLEISKESPSLKRPLYTLTIKGQKAFESLFPRHIGRVKKLMPPLRAEFISLLRRIANQV